MTRPNRARQPGLYRMLTASCLLSAGLVMPATAQDIEPDAEHPGSGELDVAVFVGWLSPLANLTDDPESFGTSLDPYAVFGADVTFWLSDRLGIGGVGIYSPSRLDVFATQFQGVIPDELGDLDYLAAAGNLVYRFASGGTRSGIEPFLAAGAGIRHMSVDEALTSPQVESSTDLVGTVAGGARIRLMPRLWLRGEVRDFIYSYEAPNTGDSRLQNDVTISLGLGTRLH